MTYNVFGGMLNLAQSINLSRKSLLLHVINRMLTAYGVLSSQRKLGLLSPTPTVVTAQFLLANVFAICYRPSVRPSVCRL